MTLKAILDSLDGVADSMRGEYEEFDGPDGKQFRLSVDGAEALVDTTGLKDSLEKERKKGKLVDFIRKEFPSATDDELRELVKKAKAMKGKVDSVEDRDKLEKSLRAEFEEEYGPIKQELTDLKTSTRSKSKREQLRKDAKDAGVLDEDLDDAVDLTEREFDLDEKGRVFHKDADGDPDTLTTKKFYSDVFKKRKPKFYKAPNASGSDADTARSPRGTQSNADDLKDLSPEARLTEARKRGLVSKKT